MLVEEYPKEIRLGIFQSMENASLLQFIDCQERLLNGESNNSLDTLYTMSLMNTVFAHQAVVGIELGENSQEISLRLQEQLGRLHRKFAGNPQRKHVYMEFMKNALGGIFK
jgi:hypothetical protein